MTAPAVRVAAVVLAAGESRRFGGNKLVALLDGRPLLQHVVDAANASAADGVIVVVGHRADDVVAAVRLGRARVVRNDAYASGRSTSLLAGLRAAGQADAIVVVLGDQPGVTAALIDAVVDRQRSTRAPAVISWWNGRRSPPALLHRDLWRELETTSGDVGARDLLAGRDDVAVLDVHDGLGRLKDVDTPEDLARLAAPLR